MRRTYVGESRLFYVKWLKHGFRRRMYGLPTAKVRRIYGASTMQPGLKGGSEKKDCVNVNR